MLDRNPETAFQGQPTVLPRDCHGFSVAGAAHSVNQDDYLLAPLGVVQTSEAADGTPCFLFAVADGIGGG
ncbi:MAG: hypothetical protein EHM91_01210, partial [Planctomycetota bacterium]